MTNWLITGVSGGLGRALAQAALTRGDALDAAIEAALHAAALSLAYAGARPKV